MRCYRAQTCTSDVLSKLTWWVTNDFPSFSLPSSQALFVVLRRKSITLFFWCLCVCFGGCWDPRLSALTFPSNYRGALMSILSSPGVSLGKELSSRFWSGVLRVYVWYLMPCWLCCFILAHNHLYLENNTQGGLPLQGLPITCIPSLDLKYPKQIAEKS